MRRRLYIIELDVSCQKELSTAPNPSCPARNALLVALHKRIHDKVADASKGVRHTSLLFYWSNVGSRLILLEKVEKGKRSPNLRRN